MIFPRTKRQSVRYGRHKALAAGLTFVVVWTLLHLTGIDDRIRGRFRPAAEPVTPEEAFRHRWSGVSAAGEGVVERVDPSIPGQVSVRTASDHPIRLRDDARIGTEGVTAGDSIRFRGVYTWDTRGGVVDASDGEILRFGRRGPASAP